MLLAATGSYYPLMQFRVPPKGQPYKDLPDHSAGSKWLPPFVSLNPKSRPRSKLSEFLQRLIIATETPHEGRTENSVD